MTKTTKLFKYALINFVVIAIFIYAIVSGVLGQSYNANQANGTYFSNLVLNIYIDEAGKALITGYADNIDGLPF